MVWCVDPSLDFGRFFPQGKFIGWDEAIEYHFNNVLSAEERKKYDNRLAVYESKVSQKFYSVMGSIEEHEWPKEYRLSRDYKQLGALLQASQRLSLVSSELKMVIETHEPDIHQFRPIRLLLSKN